MTVSDPTINKLLFKLIALVKITIMVVSYLSEIEKAIQAFDPDRANKYFVFGSAARGKHFHDIDLGVIGNKQTGKSLEGLRDIFYDSPIPYKVDVIDMDGADEDFRSYVMNQERIVWI